MHRLRPGAHIYRTPEGAWRISSDGDSFAKVSGPDWALHALQLEAADAPAEIADDGRDPAVMDALVASLRERGLIARDAPEPRRRAILITGENPIAEAAARLLEASGAEVRRAGTRSALPPAPEELSGVDAVVSCVGWLADRQWLAMDERVAGAGVPWQRVHAEGPRFYIGPVSAGAGWADYSDARGRRLAASETPDELLAHWAYLEGGQPVPAVGWPDAAGCAIVAGLLIGDLQRAMRGGEPEWTQWGVSTDPFDITAHPVLPLPRTSRR